MKQIRLVNLLSLHKDPNKRARAQDLMVLKNILKFYFLGTSLAT